MTVRAARHLKHAVFGAAIAYSLYLQTLIPAEVFVTGDSGLKALMTHQFARGDFHTDLRMQASVPWAPRLWAQGLYPFRPPYVYELADKHFIRFPLTLPFLTAPFYGAFGFRGLTVLPLLAIWVLWWRFLSACESLHIGDAAATVGFAALAFGSYLTYYSATFWDHAPAVALVCSGAFLVIARPPTLGTALVSGACLGGAVWLREEVLLFVSCLALVPAVSRGGGWPRWSLLVWWCAIASAVTALLLFNQAIYGSVFGVHGLTVVDELRATGAERGWLSLQRSGRDFLVFFPPALLAFPLFFGPRRRKSALAQVLLAALVFALAAPWLIRIFGKEWGPRFLLPAVPVFCLGIAETAERAKVLGRRYKTAAVVACAILLALGIHRNTIGAAQELSRRYARRAASFHAVKADPSPVVAVSHEFVAQQLAGLDGSKLFFLTPRAVDIKALAVAVDASGDSRFLYVCDPTYECGPTEAGVAARWEARERSGLRIVFRRLAGVDRYVLYEALLARP